MKTFITLFLCTGLVPFVTKSVEIKEDAKRLITTTCNDVRTDCAAYPTSVCSDPTYTVWVKDNCKKTCNLCPGGSSGVPQPAIPQPAVPQTGGGSTSGCSDKRTDCSSYGQNACSGQYLQWATENCAKTCKICAGGSSVPQPTVPQPTVPQPTVPQPVLPQTGGGSTSGCSDKRTDCSSYGQSSCSGQYLQWATENCAKTCKICASIPQPAVPQPALPQTGGGSTSACNDVRTDCAAYPTSVCSDPTYTVWVKDNCKKTCNLCPGGSSVPQPTVPQPAVPQTGGGSTSGCSDKRTDCSSYGQTACSGQYLQWGTENCAKTCKICGSNPSGSGSIPGSSMAPSSGNGGSFSSSSTGCYYNKKVYQQDQSWNDGCKYKCRCTDGASGKYECRQLCLSWNLPPTCHMNPPATGKCCPRPECPSNIVLQYPDGFVEE